MRLHFWSFALQWSRFGVNALVFLLAARFLTLGDLGAFATAYAPVKLLQGLHKTGIVETVVIKRATALRLETLFGISLFSGILLALALALAAMILALPEHFTALALIPLFLGVSSVSDGLLRKRLKLRALALRTAFAQGVAGAATVVALIYGAKSEALVIFAVLNIALYAGVTLVVAGWIPQARPKMANMKLPLKTIGHIFLRDLFNAGILPLAQIAIGLCIGLSAGGAFQIATRVFSMLDALALSPLRYLALPKLAALKSAQGFEQEIHKSLRLCASLACWIWFGVAASAVPILTLIVGAAHSKASAPLVIAMFPMGLSAAIGMPFAQALLARGFTRLLYHRAILLFVLSCLFTLPVIFRSPHLVVMALSAANLCTLIWFITKALPVLALEARIFWQILPAFVAGGGMWAVLSMLTLSLPAQIGLGSVFYVIMLSPALFKMRRHLQI